MLDVYRGVHFSILLDVYLYIYMSITPNIYIVLSRHLKKKSQPKELRLEESEIPSSGLCSWSFWIEQNRWWSPSRWSENQGSWKVGFQSPSAFLGANLSLWGSLLHYNRFSPQCSFCPEQDPDSACDALPRREELWSRKTWSQPHHHGLGQHKKEGNNDFLKSQNWFPAKTIGFFLWVMYPINLPVNHSCFKKV